MKVQQEGAMEEARCILPAWFLPRDGPYSPPPTPVSLLLGFILWLPRTPWLPLLLGWDKKKKNSYDYQIHVYKWQGNLKHIYRICKIFFSEIIVVDVFLLHKNSNLKASLVNFRNWVSFVQSCHCVSKSHLICSVPGRLGHGKLIKTFMFQIYWCILKASCGRSNVAVPKLNLRN